MRNRIRFSFVLIGFCALVASPDFARAEEPSLFEGGPEKTYSVPPSMVGRHNDNWHEGTLAHIGRLSERRAQLCPTLCVDKPIGEELRKILKGAAKIAI